MTTRERNYRKHPHTASFLQTFHTGISSTGRNYREEMGVETTEEQAVAFVTNRPARPEVGTLVTIKGYPVRIGAGFVTEPQAKWIIDIATTRVIPNGATAESVLVRLEQGFAKFAGSQFITTYKDLPRKAQEAAMVEAVAPMADSAEEVRAAYAPKVEADGIYIDPENGRIFKVQFNKGQGSGRHLYAKQLWIDLPAGWRSEHLLSLDTAGIDRDEIHREWRYAPGLIKAIKPDWKLTPEQAEAYGALYGSCIRCGRDLTKESSIRRSMGDKCASKSGF